MAKGTQIPSARAHRRKNSYAGAEYGIFFNCNWVDTQWQ